MEKIGNSAESLFDRKQRPRAVWVEKVRDFRKSGLTAEEYAAEKGLKLRTLKSWIRVLQNDGETMAKGAGPTFLPVSVLHAVKTPESSATVMVEVDLANGRRVRMHVRPDADFKRVSDLLDAVEGGLRC